jgi:hypothetical protein
LVSELLVEFDKILKLVLQLNLLVAISVQALEQKLDLLDVYLESWPNQKFLGVRLSGEIWAELKETV